MLTIFTDNTINLGSINDRQESNLVITSMIRGIERIAGYLLCASLSPVVAGHAHSMRGVRAAKGSQQRFIATKRWQPGMSGNLPLSHGLPMGSGILQAG